MTLLQTLNELQTRGVTLAVDGARLAYSPRSAVTPELLENIRLHKPALVTWVATGRLPCDHLDPATWAHRDGVAYCRGCQKYQGRVAR